jgi:hypothetical protein
MASNVKWFKRAYRVLNAGHTELWELIKHRLPEKRRNFLENKFLKKEPRLPTDTLSTTEPPTQSLPPQEPTNTIAATTKKATTKKATTKKATTRRTNKNKTTAGRATRTTSKEK